jgi:CPA2 family monovalent cation:H+ antiporter-2
VADNQLIVDLVLAVVAAFVGGIVAQRLHQPVILGYLVAGVLIGPFTPGPTASQHSIETLAEIGVAFLMFALGAELSLEELQRLGRLATLGGPLQILATMALGPLLAPILGLSFVQGVFLGALLALSSTVVVLKVLMGRGEQQSLHGRATLGILIAQDLAVVPMVIVLPALGGGDGAQVARDLTNAAVKVALVLLAVYAIGTRLVPWLLERAALPRTRELFILGVVGLALGTAVVTQLAGLSLAFGAFLAGLVVAESTYRTQVIAEVLPLRDLFAALFFVSVGMLINPGALLAHIRLVVPLVVAVIVGKSLLSTLVVLLLGWPVRAAVLTGLSLAQVGEFSFVLARIGVTEGVVPGTLFDLILATALVTIVLTPFLLRGAPLLQGAFDLLPLARDPSIGDEGARPVAEGLRGHTIIAGYGRVGRELADELHRRGEGYVVVEYNPALVRELRARGVPIVYGDAANPIVLDHAAIEAARLLAVLVPDVATAELATRAAHGLRPDLDIVARVSQATDVERLRQAGATEVVQPEFEAGVEVIRHALARYGVGADELDHEVATRRQSFYQGEAPG